MDQNRQSGHHWGAILERSEVTNQKRKEVIKMQGGGGGGVDRGGGGEVGGAGRETR